MRPLVSWLPVLLLLGGVANHAWFVHQHQLSPWLGAGFGMFSTTDVGSTRRVYLTAVLENGSDYWVELDDAHFDTLARARALPNDRWLSRLADATFEALKDDEAPSFPNKPMTLRIEIWRNIYATDTLKASATLLAKREFPFPDDFSG